MSYFRIDESVLDYEVVRSLPFANLTNLKTKIIEGMNTLKQIIFREQLLHNFDAIIKLQTKLRCLQTNYRTVDKALMVCQRNTIVYTEFSNYSLN
jgi:hypothetical protein